MSLTDKLKKSAGVGLIGSTLAFSPGCRGVDFRPNAWSLLSLGLRVADIASRRNNVNVIQQPNQFFACNGWRDFNGNGTLEYSGEIVGMKNNFFTSENVTFMSIIHNKTGSILDYRLFNQFNNLIYDDNQRIDRNGYVRWYTQRCGPGTYTGYWYLNGNLIGSTRVNVR